MDFHAGLFLCAPAPGEWYNSGNTTVRKEMTADQIIRSSRRTLSLEIEADGRLVVRAPLRISERAIAAFIRQKQAWVLRQQQLMRERQRTTPVRQFAAGELFSYLGGRYALVLVETQAVPLRLDGEFRLIKYYQKYARGIFMRWYQQQALRHIASRCACLGRQTGLIYTKVRITNGLSRWGYCGADNSLSFNWRLVMAPASVVDYVVVHELAHSRFKDHSRRYWRLVERLMPGYAVERRWLKEFGHTLVL